MKPLRIALLTMLMSGAGLISTQAAAQTSINLGNYQVTGSYTLDVLGGMGLEASAVTYARDRGSLFFVGDEGLGVVEVSLTGQTLGSMALNWSGTGSSNNDSEGLTYLGDGKLVLVDERPQIAYSFSYAAGSTLSLNSQPWAAITGSTTSVGNVGTEGISVDPRDGSFFSVKQDNPAQLRQSTLNFAVGGGSVNTNVLFNGATSLFGLASLSDIQTLSGVDALVGAVAADNLLVLSLDSKTLVELNRSTGQVLSSFNFSGVTTQAIEGVTIDEAGRIYLVAEGVDAGTPSQLFVLSSVPEPHALLLLSLGGLAVAWRRRR